MADVVVLQEGEEPKDPRNFVLVEQIPAPRGAPRYRVVAQGVNDDGPVGIQKTVDSLELIVWTNAPPQKCWAEGRRRSVALVDARHECLASYALHRLHLDVAVLTQFPAGRA